MLLLPVALAERGESETLSSADITDLVSLYGDDLPAPAALDNSEQLLKTACTLPVTSVECERSISRLRHLKTHLRSTMQEERLNGLAMSYIHRDISCSAEAVADEFARCHPRRIH